MIEEVKLSICLRLDIINLHGENINIVFVVLVNIRNTDIWESFQKPYPKELEKQDSFSLFFNTVPLDINALHPTMLKYCNSITKEGGILVF